MLEANRSINSCGYQIHAQLPATVIPHCSHRRRVIPAIQILARDPETQRLPVARRAAEAIRRNARVQTQLISDLLDLSRLQTGKLALECHPVSLAALVAEGAEALRPEAEARGVALRVEGSGDAALAQAHIGRARALILKLHCQGKPQDAIDFDAVAKATGDFSGADLKAVVERAVEGKLKEAMRTGKPTPLTTADVRAAAAGLTPSTREWFADARNYALYANDGGQYDELVKHLKLR